MTLFGIKSRRGGGSVKGNGNDHDDEWNRNDPNVHSSCRQLLPVTAAAAVTEPDAVERAMFRRRLKNRPRIPLVIRCGEEKSSSPTLIKINKSFPIKLSPKKKWNDTSKVAAANECPAQICLRLLESNDYHEQRLGMEQLVVIVNRELVNSKQEGSLAEALLYKSVDVDDDHQTDDRFSDKIRSIFPSFFTDEILDRKVSNHTNTRHPPPTKAQQENETHESQSTDETSLYSDLSVDSSSENRHRRRTSLKLPALSVLISCLELASLQKPITKPHRSLLDLNGQFWKCILPYMVDSLDKANVERIEGALCVKGFRLLLKLDQENIGMYLAKSVLPLIPTAKEYGRVEGDKMLVRECDRLLLACSS